MALINCKECGREVSSEAKSCPNCGIRLAGGLFAGLRKVFLWTLAIVLLVLFIARLGGGGTQQTAGLSAAGYEIRRLCHGAISNQLKAPSSADYPEQGISVLAFTEKNQVVMSGPVDAQNSFGAKIRTNYMCILEGPQGGWKLKDASFPPGLNL